MAAPPANRLQNMLQTAVQTVQWTYSLFWQLCPQQGILVWGDGYYNGAIKTMKTVQPMEVSKEQASLQRSQQLIELYESLSAGESNHQTRRPSAALSPEDLTESEWFYLMCISFSFPPGVGLPGEAYAQRQHVWLNGANKVDTKVFSRAILAKSARIQTVVCIPLSDGVVEVGTTKMVQEDIGFIQQVMSFFIHHHPPQPPKPALSDHSTTSNPASSSDHMILFQSHSMAAMDSHLHLPDTAGQIDDDEDEEEDPEQEEEGESESETDTERNRRLLGARNTGILSQGLAVVAHPAAPRPSELTPLELSEDIRMGSPDDGSNHLDSNLQLLALSQAGNPTDLQLEDDSCRSESSYRWPFMQDPLSSRFQPRPSGSQELAVEDTHYTLTVSTILQHQSSWSTSSSSMAGDLICSSQSAFSDWTIRSADHHILPISAEDTSQWVLKYILFTVPFLHAKYSDENSPRSRNAAESASRFRKGTPQDELNANHVLAERRRREKLNERFITLRSLVPFVTRMDKASILGDTIEYLKQLRTKIQDLEARENQMEVDQQWSRSLSGVTAVVDRARLGGVPPGSDKRKVRIVEETGVAKPRAVDSPSPPHPVAGVTVQVSIIESNALVELECAQREGLLLDVMVVLRELQVEVTAVQSSFTNGVMVAELKAKVKENVEGRKPISWK